MNRWTGRARPELQAELAAARRNSSRINYALWGIAAGVMIYGAGNVTALLLAHATPWPTAWLLSGMVDLGLCVALWGDRVLHTYGRRETWLTALRWITAAMTWALNIAGNALPRHGRADWVGVGIHSCGPVLLVVVAEAAGAIQRHVTTIITDIEAALAELSRTTSIRKPAQSEPATHTHGAKQEARTKSQSNPSNHRPAKEQVVRELSAHIAADPENWAPDYPALMKATGFSRSWCEKRVAEARSRVDEMTAAEQTAESQTVSAISAQSAEIPIAASS